MFRLPRHREVCAIGSACVGRCIHRCGFSEVFKTQPRHATIRCGMRAARSQMLKCLFAMTSALPPRNARPLRHRPRHPRPRRRAGRRTRPTRAPLGRPARAEGAALPGEGEARRPPVHERRAVAGRYVRPQAAARQVPRQAAPDRQPPHRAQDRRGDAVAVQVQEVRPVRHRGERAVRQDRRGTSTTCASSARCTPTCRTTSRR